MERKDVLDAIMLGNDVAMQWYALTHDMPLPGTGGTVYVPPGPNTTGRLQISTGTILVLGGLALALYLAVK